MPPTITDKTTFQYGELRAGNAAARAYANMVTKFVHQFANTAPMPTSSSTATQVASYNEGVALYHALLHQIFDRLLQDEGLPRDEKMLKALDEALTEKKNALLEEERRRTRKQPKARQLQRVVDLNASSDSDSSDDDEETAAAKAKAKAEEEERKKEAYLEQCRLEETRELERLENEEQLKERMRQVDTKAFEDAIQQGKVELLNEGGFGGGKNQKKSGGKKGGGGNNKNNNVSQEEVDQLMENLSRVQLEMEWANEIQEKSMEEVPATLASWKEVVEALEARRRESSIPDTPPQAPEMKKGQMTEAQTKLSKQTMKKNQLLLEIRSMEAYGDALAELIKKRAELVTLLQRVKKNIS